MSEIRIKRGPASQLPVDAALGEPLYTTDEGSENLYIGNGPGVMPSKMSGVNGEVQAALEMKVNAVDVGTAAAKDVPVTGNASSGQVVLGNDSRLSNSRTPTAHKASHAAGGGDELTPSDIGAADKAMLPSYNAADFDGDDIGARINAAVAYVGEAGGGAILVNDNPGTVKTPIVIDKDNIWLHGSGKYSTKLVADTSLGTNRVIQVLGTTGAHVKNVTISDITVQNGTPSTTTYTAGMDGIRADYFDSLSIQRTNITSIQGAYGIAAKNGTGLKVLDNDVTNFTYAGIMVLSGVDYSWIQRNTVSGATVTGSGANAYGIEVGSYEAAAENTYYPRYAWVTDNTVKNIPTWKGIGSHGGNHLWIERNTIENVHHGVLVALAESGVTSPSLSDIHISGNTVTQGTGNADGYGVNLTGGGSGANNADGGWVKDNTVTGFGATATAGTYLIGAIQLNLAQNVKVQNNSIQAYNQAAIFLNSQVWDVDVIGNNAGDLLSSFSSGITSMLYANIGVWGIGFDGNKLVPSSAAAAPAFQYRTGSSAAGSVSIGANYAKAFSNAQYSGAWIPANFSATPTSVSKVSGKTGDRLLDTNGKAQWMLNSGSGYASMDSTSVISVGSITAGQNTVSVLSGGLGGATWYYWYPVGMKVTIAGAGPGGAALSAKVIANNNTTLTLDANAATTVTGANITYQATTLVTANSPHASTHAAGGTDPISLSTIGAATLPSYASNAAAVTGGLVVGTLYRQGDFVAVVH